MDQQPTAMPPGWYPDPTRPGYQRQWNGTEWVGNQVPIGAKGGFPKVLIPVIACLGLMFVAVIVGALAGDPDEDVTAADATTEPTATEAPSSTTEATTTSTTEAPATTASTTTTTEDTTTTAATDVLAGCVPADQADIDLITGFLAAPAAELREAYIVRGPGGRRYLGANVFDAAGERLSVLDVWLFDNSIPFALSGSARNDLTPLLPDGRDRPGNPSAGDEFGTAATDCTRAALAAERQGR